MPVIVKQNPDGSKKIINRPSVIIKDPQTGKNKRAPTTITIIPAPADQIAEQQSTSDITGNIALIGAALAKAVQFVTRSGVSSETSVSTKTSSKTNPSLRGAQDSSRGESLLSLEAEKVVSATPEELAQMAKMNAPAEYIKIDYSKIEGVKEATRELASVEKAPKKKKDNIIKKIKKIGKKKKKGRGREL